MFNCTTCKKTVGPKVSPIAVIGDTRNVEYLNIVRRVDENDVPYKEEVHSKGTEIVTERRLCHECAGTEPQRKAIVGVRGGYGFVERMPEPMRVKLAAVAIQKVLVWLDQMNKRSKRTERDIAAAAPGLKQFVELNPDTI